jgi:hypothetical protein
MIPMATAKKRAKAHALMNRVADEPMIDQDNYNVSITTAMVWYRDNVDDKKRRKFALEYFAKLGKKKEVLAINKADDYEIRQLGSLCRLVANGNTLSEDHMKAIDNMVNNIVAKEALPKKIKEDKTVIVPVVAAPSIQDRMDEKAHDLAGEIEGAIDEFVTNKSTSFSTKNYLLANEVSAPIAKRIGDFYVGRVKELREAIAGDDDQLVEGYSNFTKRELKKFADFMESIVSDCNQQVQTAKASRAPRKRKAASPTKVVSKLKYMREFAELKLKSCKPEDIIGASELWVYNTKYRKVQVYRAESPLSVKGTTILGFDVKNSQSMTLRKPEEFFKGLSMGKRALNGAIKKLTTKPTTPNGRVNEECVLLGAF